MIISHTLSAIATPKHTQALLNSIEEIRKQENIAAVGLVIVENGKTTWMGGLGTLVHGSDVSVSENTLFRVGSITKSFTSLAILYLQERGKLSLNDNISRWVPADWYHNAWEQYAPIKIVHLLEQTAGFPDISKAEFDYNEPGLVPVGRNLKRFRENHRSEWQPGRHVSYSNLGAAYAGYIIERTGGSDYESFVTQTLFQPLAMEQSSFMTPTVDQKHFASGYDSDGTTPVPYWHMVYRPFGGINSTVKDMSHFLEMLINKGEYNQHQLLTPESIERMESPHSSLAARSGLTFGYGLGNYQWLHDQVLFHGHGGDADGYLSRYAYTRNNNNGYFVVISAYNYRALGKIRGLLEDYLTKDIKDITQAQVVTLNKQQMNKTIGTYEAVTSRFSNHSLTKQLIIFEKGNAIYSQIGKRRARKLIPVSNEHFRREDENQATIAIVEASDGTLYFQDDNANFRKIERPLSTLMNKGRR